MGISYTFSDPSGFTVVGAYARTNQWMSTADEGGGVGQAIVLTYLSPAHYSAGNTPIRQTPIDFTLDAITTLPVVEGVRDAVDAVILTMPAAFPDAIIIPDPPPVGVSVAEDLEMVRTRYLTAIESEKDKRISVTGFEYPPASGKVFSLTARNRDYVLSLNSADTRNVLPYPFAIRTADERDTVSLADAAEALAFYYAAMAAVQVQRDAATPVKIAVLAAADIPAIEAAAAAYLAGA